MILHDKLIKRFFFFENWPFSKDCCLSLTAGEPLKHRLFRKCLRPGQVKRHGNRGESS